MVYIFTAVEPYVVKLKLADEMTLRLCGMSDECEMSNTFSLSRNTVFRKLLLNDLDKVTVSKEGKMCFLQHQYPYANN